MTNAQKLLHELTRAARRGCTRTELEAAGVTHVEIEIDRLRRRRAVIRDERLPRSGQRRYILLLGPSDPQPEVAPDPVLFDAEEARARPASPYDIEAA